MLALRFLGEKELYNNDVILGCLSVFNLIEFDSVTFVVPTKIQIKELKNYFLC
jgi:hypothetical protein